ncbi:MAG: acyl-CoA dehydrogenase family protein [Deltaproteobacteria bacterium]|nr:acyl-CoA dehydrogenase family protein [Deltaproteobacteria bacterium]
MSLSFNFSEEQLALQSLAHDFAKDVIRPVSHHHDKTGEYPWGVLQKAHEMGLLNTHVPNEYGGLGLNNVDGIIMAEELAWGCSGIGTAMEANGLAQAPVILGGSEYLKQKYLTPQCEPREKPMMCAYAVTEPGAGSDVQGLKTTAVKQGDKWILNGSKMWITNAGVADWYFVVAVTDPSKLARGGMTAFIVERSWPGVVVGKKEWNMGQRCSDTRGLSFDNVEVPEANVVGQVGDGWKLAMSAFDHTRPSVSAAAIGVARAAMEHAAQYATERKTFGQPIANHQSIQFMIAEMAMEIEAGRNLCLKAAWLKDNGQRNTVNAAYAKAFCADLAMKTTTNAVQIFGGYGYSEEYPVEKLMRDAKIFQIYEGTSQIQRLIIARELFVRNK